MLSRKYNYNQKGYVALLGVIVIGAAATTIAVSLLIAGADFARMGLSLEQSAQSRALVDACAEEALQNIRDNEDFSGNGSLTLEGDACDYSVAIEEGENRTIQVNAQVDQVTRKLEIKLNQLNPKLNVTSWQELP